MSAYSRISFRALDIAKSFRNKNIKVAIGGFHVSDTFSMLKERDAHVETVLRRAIATGTSAGKTMFFITRFNGCIDIEKIHPLEVGFLRRRFRTSRRSNLPLENPLIFCPKNFPGTL